MGVYIKDMEMPKNCLVCPFMVSRDNDDCILQSDEANEGFENWEQMKDGCPLISVSPHGDLIERSAASLSDFEIAMCDGSFKEGMKMLLEKIEDAPTILEADEADMDSFIRIFKEDDEEDGMDSFIRILKDE